MLGSQAIGCFSEQTADAPNDDDGNSTDTSPGTSTGSTTSSGGPSSSPDATATSGESVDTSSTTTDSTTTDGTTTTGDVDCALPPEIAWDDEFDRPDGDDLGDCWVEKSPSVWQLADGDVVSAGEGKTAAFDHMVWRDDLHATTVEIILEFRIRTGDLRNEPHAFARMTDASLEPGAFYEGYALMPRASDGGSEPMQLCLMRFNGGANASEQRCEDLPTPLELGPTRHRLVLQVAGPGPVLLDGRIDVLHGGDPEWSPLLTLAQWQDESPDQIVTAGAVGFSGGNVIDVLDNFVIEFVRIHHIG